MCSSDLREVIVSGKFSILSLLDFAMEVKDDNIRKTSFSQVLYALSKIKKTATAPDGFPFWAWKEIAAILTTAIKTIWNLSSSRQT